MDARKKNSWVNDDEQCNAHIVHAAQIRRFYRSCLHIMHAYSQLTYGLLCSKMCILEFSVKKDVYRFFDFNSEVIMHKVPPKLTVGILLLDFAICPF